MSAPGELKAPEADPVYGAGHAYWLRHFIENTPGIRLVDPAPYLART